METLNFHDIKVEKANALLRYRKRQRVKSLLRSIELCIFFVIVTRFSTQLPLTLKLPIEYFRELGVTLISPWFVFVLGNVIVIILFLISGQSSACISSSITNSETKGYEQNIWMKKVAYCEKSIVAKEAYCEPRKKQRKTSILVEKQADKRIHRSHSEKSLIRCHETKPRKELIRSATVGRGNIIYTDSAKSMTKTKLFPEDEMSSDEFKKTVEAFIARQQRLLREEEFSATVKARS